MIRPPPAEAEAGHSRYYRYVCRWRFIGRRATWLKVLGPGRPASYWSRALLIHWSPRSRMLGALGTPPCPRTPQAASR